MCQYNKIMVTRKRTDFNETRKKINKSNRFLCQQFQNQHKNSLFPTRHNNFEVGFFNHVLRAIMGGLNEKLPLELTLPAC